MSVWFHKVGNGRFWARRSWPVASVIGVRAFCLFAATSAFLTVGCIGGRSGGGNVVSTEAGAAKSGGFEIQLNNELLVKVQVVALGEAEGRSVLGTVGAGEQRRFTETPAGEALDGTGTFVVVVSEGCVGTEYERRRAQSEPLEWTLSTPLDELFDVCSDGSCVARGQGCELECAGGALECGQFCIPPEQRCDGIADCEDGSDERAGCDVGGPTMLVMPPSEVGAEPGNVWVPHIDPGPCLPGEAPCDEGCIPAFHWCDGVAHCPQGEDELAACVPDPACREDELHCGDGSCQPRGWGCDGNIDCMTGWDEPPSCGSCPVGQVACEDGVCLASSARCDGVLDCPTGGDEPSTCADEQCGENFLCGDGSCVPSAWRCDGRSDCQSGKDEEECGACPGRFQCPEGSCLPFSSVCDGRADCVGGTDEVKDLCEVGTCQSGEISCGAGSCCPEAFPICCLDGETCGQEAADCD